MRGTDYQSWRDHYIPSDGTPVEGYEADRLETLKAGYPGWMVQVDKILLDRYGLFSTDFDDYLWFDHYQDGLTPSEAVLNFCEDAGMVSHGAC